MPRRVALPGASELFRPTSDAAGRLVDGDSETSLPDTGPNGSGRIRHTEKITVYLSTDELLALEQARLRLRSAHGTAVDRGRIVRAAIAMALDSLGVDGSDSELLRRLSTRDA